MDVDARVRVDLLGDFRVRRGDAQVRVSGARLRSLAARLALAGGRHVDRSTLVDAIWSEDPPADATHALQALVSRLRRAVGSAAAVPEAAGGYRLRVRPDDVDALRFEELAVAGRERLRAGDPVAASALLDEAVALWGDRPGSEPVTVAAVAPAAAVRLARVAVDAVADLAESELALDAADSAAARLSALLAERPTDERAAALLMDALVVQGRPADALASYERIRRTLAGVLGTGPGEPLRRRHLSLLRDDRPVPDARPVPDGHGNRDRHGNLPEPLTSFVGRDDDIARISGLLASGRIVTVVGPGGAGKTRLAVEAARGLLRRFGDRVRMIDLAPVTDPAEVAPAVLAGAGMRRVGLLDGRVRSAGSVLDTLVDELADREWLLVVDNCEQVIAPAADLVAALLVRCRGLHVLATSREPLAIDGEVLVTLGPLALPGPDDGLEAARRTPSVELFAARAAAVRPGFQVDGSTLPLVRSVVVGLDGLPLALELAAARLRTLSLPELADGLSDRFRLLTTGSRTASPRHRTLGAVIAWSWELLGPHERALAERVAVMPGGVTGPAAAALCADGTVPPEGIPEMLAGLVDRSLLQLAAEPGRYRMLETVRAYGTDRLRAAGELDDTHERAARYLDALLARQEPRLRGPDQVDAMRIVGSEYDNVLAALRRRCDAGDADGAVGLALRLVWYWQMVGLHADAAHWLGAALAVPGGTSALRTTATAAHLLSRVEGRAAADAREADDDTARMRQVADRLADVPDQPGPLALYGPILRALLGDDRSALDGFDRLVDGRDVWVSGLARMFRAQLAENLGDLERVRADLPAALDCFGRFGDRWGRASVLPMRARLRQYDGDLDGAMADLREARSLAEHLGLLDVTDQVYGDLSRAELLVRRGDDGQALEVLDAARDRARRSGSADLMCLVGAREAGLRLLMGEVARARELIEETERDMHDVHGLDGDRVRTLLATARARVDLADGDRDGAAAALSVAYASAVATADRPLLSVVAVGVAELAGALRGDRDLAVLLGAASRLRGVPDHGEPVVRELERRGCRSLGDEAFASAWAEGWDSDGERAVARVDPAVLLDDGRRSRPPRTGPD